MQQASVVHNEPNTNVYKQAKFVRQGDITNIIEDGYEYAQPLSCRLVANSQFQVENPFGTYAQVALLYANVNDSNGLLALSFDNNDQSSISNATSIVGFPGFLISQTGLAPLAPFAQWTDLHEFINVRASGITSFTEFCLVFRRKQEQIIPRNITAFNGPEQ